MLWFLGDVIYHSVGLLLAKYGPTDEYGVDLGFGQDDILEMCETRGKGVVYVRENCYGWNGPWAYRSGWQQISDAVSGVEDPLTKHPD